MLILQATQQPHADVGEARRRAKEKGRPGQRDAKACINGTPMKYVSNFRHLGTQQEANASTDFDVHARLNLARVRFNEMYCTFKSTTLGTSLKLRLFKVCMRSQKKYDWYIFLLLLISV